MSGPTRRACLRALAVWITVLALFAPHDARAVLTGVAALPSPAQVKTPVTIVAQGSATTCTAFVDFGDGTNRTIPNSRLPFTLSHTYSRPGTYLIQVDCGITLATTLTVAPSASLPFSLARVELRWENGRGYVSVPKGHEGLSATADLLFNGSGRLVAQWEVDGRVLAIVNEFLTFGARKTLRTPAVPPLPTFEPGMHGLTLRVVQPATTFAIPTIQYFVSASPEAPPALELLAPEPDAQVSTSPLAFRWKAFPRAVSYRVDVFEGGAPRTVASALTRETAYSLTPALERGLTPLESYRWQVTAIDAAGGAIGESAPRAFSWDGAGSPDRVIPNQLLVALRGAAPSELEALVAELATRYGLRRVESAALESLELVVVAFEPNAGGSVAAAVRALRGDERIVLAEPHFVFATQADPGDPLLGLQYAPKLIGAVLAHARATGRGVRIAVIDSAIAADHPDLAGRIALAADFTGDGASAELHGTGVAGVVAALEGNGVGIAGIAPGADLLALRACRALDASRADARCSALALARAFDFALRNGARVVNLSLGGPRDALVTRLVERAEILGCLVVAAAGNQGANAGPLYPAALDTVVAVSAVDAKGEPDAAATRADFIDLAAPGVEVLTTAPGARYSAQTGSSLAAAHVSAVAALVLELRPSLSPRELRALLEDSARALPPEAHAGFGRGRVDACRALERVLGEFLGCPP